MQEVIGQFSIGGINGPFASSHGYVRIHVLGAGPQLVNSGNKSEYVLPFVVLCSRY